MKALIASIAALMAITSLSGCASIEPEPCSAEWIEWKSERVLHKFARQNRGLVRDLRKFSKNMEEPSALQMLQMASRIDDFKKLAVSFEKTVLPELNAAAAQCGDPATFIPAFTQFLRDQGVEEEMLKWVTTFGAIAIEASQQSRTQ